MHINISVDHSIKRMQECIQLTNVDVIKPFQQAFENFLAFKKRKNAGSRKSVSEYLNLHKISHWCVKPCQCLFSQFVPLVNILSFPTSMSDFVTFVTVHHHRKKGEPCVS
ncbi:hypothetical protein PoB_000218600 [Plakobranchus ocellatus]|uniref:Uncharacterized protein n=1 Tax=Plakobranchus ocellatus TaxID=259542 RepID=A0AAV3X8C0_9GAST|nr:hypothetical protein PoB_000218600 [Plakobranchus ocellatus]